MPKNDGGLDYFGTDGFSDAGLPWGEAEDWFGLGGWGDVAMFWTVWETGAVDMSSDSFVGADMSSEARVHVEMSSDEWFAVGVSPET